MKKFKATIDIIGINPFVFLPDTVLLYVFKQAQKDKGPIPVRGTIDGHTFIQTLVKYSGHWRLYINMAMVKAANKKVGDTIVLQIEFDPEERIIPVHPKLLQALKQNKKAKQVFDALRPSLQKEIIRYISYLKSEEAINKNVTRAIQFLLGKARFVGRDRP